MIALSNVSVKAGLFMLKGVTFTIPAGAFGAVVGAAGAGKTTLLEAVAGVRTLQTGHVALHGRDVTALPPEQRAIGLAYQRGALFTHKSVLENIAWADSNTSATTLIAERLGITNLFSTPVSSLSGGERQLVALARALVRVRACLDRGQHPVLLLDEPFSALDPRRRIVTRDVIRAIHNEWALTTLQVTHDGADARRADYAVLLDAGMVVQSGTPDELMSAPVRDDVALFLSGAS
jgi:ABC-type sugar transport system ATPase subunit